MPSSHPRGPVPELFLAPPLRVPLLYGARGPHHLTRRIGEDGTTAVRVGYDGGIDLWLLPARTAAHTVARTVLGPGAAEGPVVFLRVDGHHHAASQYAAGDARARVVHLKDAVLVLATRTALTGPVPRVWLDTIAEAAVPSAPDGSFHAADEDSPLCTARETPCRTGDVPLPATGGAR
ncbi:hypothetical protein [Kitasatospora sp. NPDC059327]|uniref:hypothetical protein n=1 Tax=Kitasatospora sp. NPDC059327 TaxID=3346803 RepID=UPI003677E13D